MPNIAFVPLAFILLQEYLKQMSPKMEVLRYDYILDDPDSNELKDYYKYDIVGFQLTYPNSNIVIDLLKKWEEKKNRPFIVVGGVLASVIALELIEKYSNIDVVVVGEGEESLFNLTRVVKGEIQLKDVPGIVYRKENNLPIYNKGKKTIDFNSTIIPKRDFLYSIPKDEIKKYSIRIQSARGCLGKCSFCLNSYKNRLDKITTKAWRGMSPERVVDEIEYLYNEFGIQIINFVDPTFEDPGIKGKQRIEKIAKYLINRNIKISFKVNMRAETFIDKDMDLLWLLKEAGMDFIVLGIEACTNKELKLLGKNADIDTLTKAYWRLHNMDCFTLLVGYMPIHPYSTVDSLSNSYYYLYKLKLSCLFHIFRCVLIPLRGTNIYDKVSNDGLILNKNDIMEIPKYKFLDSKIAQVNESIQKMKVTYPLLSHFHKRSLDALNIVSRSTNRMFDNMLSIERISKAYSNYKNSINLICEEVSDRYYDFQKEIIHMARNKWDEERFEELAKKHVVEFVDSNLEKTETEMKNYVDYIHKEGYDVSVFQTEAWGSYCQERNKISTNSI